MRWLASGCAVLSLCLVEACTDAEDSFDAASAAGSVVQVMPEGERWLVGDSLYLPPGPALKAMAAPAAK
jgi:hypothetical protein